MANFSFAKTHWFSTGNTEIMPIWLPAWKTLVNSASSSSRKQTKGCLLAVLPRKVTSLHPCPRLSATLPCPEALSLSPALWLWLWLAAGHLLAGHGMCTWETPTHTRWGTGTRSSPQEVKSVLLMHLPSCKRTILFYVGPEFKASFSYFFIYYILQLHLSLSILLTYLCLLSKAFFIGNNFHFQASSRLEIQNYLSKWKYHPCPNNPILKFHCMWMIINRKYKITVLWV